MKRSYTRIALALTAFGLMIAAPVGRPSYANSTGHRAATSQGDCSRFLPIAPQVIPISGGTFNASVDTGPGGGSCVWHARSTASWIAPDMSDMEGDQNLAYTVVVNSFGGPRDGSIQIFSKLGEVLVASFSVSQDGNCPINLAPAGASFTAAGGAGAFDATTAARCSAPTSASPNLGVLWIHVNGFSGTTVSYSVDATTGGGRDGFIEIGDIGIGSLARFHISQRGANSCSPGSLVFSPESETLEWDDQQGGFSVSFPAGCSPDAAVSNADWIKGINSTPGMGSVFVSFNLDKNTGSSERTGSIDVGGKSFWVYQNAQLCPAILLCAAFPAACGFFKSGFLDTSHSFRDRILAKSARGKEYTRLYYQSSREAVRIMLSNPMLLIRSRDMITRYKPLLESMVRGEAINLTNEDLNDIDEFLGSFSDKGSPELKSAIDGLRKDLRDPAVHREFNVSVVEGQKREARSMNLFRGLKAPVWLVFGVFGLVIGGFVRGRGDAGWEKGRARRPAPTGRAGVVRRQAGVVQRTWGGRLPRFANRWLVMALPLALIVGPAPRLLARAPLRTIAPETGPALSYLSYLGGSGDDQGTAIATDSAGNAYVAGLTSSANFPTLGAIQKSFGGGQSDAFVCKISPTGKPVYSTYLGGSGQDNATSIAVDSAGNAYVAGFTGSLNFPVKNAVQPGLKGEVNAFVAKLDAAGSLVYSTYLGGGLGDIASSVAVDASGNAYVAGVSTSADFPVAVAAQPSLGGSSNAFITKLSADGSRLLYSTYLGGRDTDGASAVAVDSSGQAYIAGVTSSRTFPTVNALQPKHGGGFFDAFVAKLNSAGNQFLYCTFLGGTGEDRGLRIAVDAAGDAYVAGDTDSTDFPTVNPLQAANKGSSDSFVAKVNPSGSALVYSTYLGGSGLDGATGIAVDPSGIAYVTGFTASSDFPLTTPTQAAFGGGAFDAFVAVLNPAGSATFYSSYIGGSGIDSGFGIASDAQGGVYVMGQTNSKDIAVANAFQSSYGGDPSDVFVARAKIGPIITSAEVSGKRLMVFGLGFDDGAKILLNGDPQKTANDDQNPATTLVGRKAGKLISTGQQVMLQVQNGDGSLSNQFSFTRPATE